VLRSNTTYITVHSKEIMKLLFAILGLSLLCLGCEPVEDFQRNQYAVQGKAFSLRQYPEWVELEASQLPWGKAFEGMNPERQGFITSYFRDTMGLSMRSTQIRVEYFSRGLPNCSNNDSVSMYIEKIMKQKFGGLETFRDTAAFVTRSDAPVAYVEATSPLNQIWFAWAYIPAGSYYIAFNLSTFTENEFTLMRDKFKALVASYQEVE
jgi:hypothetical protein